MNTLARPHLSAACVHSALSSFAMRARARTNCSARQRAQKRAANLENTATPLLLGKTANMTANGRRELYDVRKAVLRSEAAGIDAKGAEER